MSNGLPGPIGAGIGFCVLFAAVVVYQVPQASVIRTRSSTVEAPLSYVVMFPAGM